MSSPSRSTREGSRPSTSSKSRRSTGSTAGDNGVSPAELARLSRPFDPAIWKKAEELAAQYSLVIEPEPRLGYFGRTVEMPTVMSDGKTLIACAQRVLEATTLAIAVTLEDGQTPPAPAREGKRDQQVNIRLTAEEKLRLEGLAAREGFRSVSDYVRSAALRPTG